MDKMQVLAMAYSFFAAIGLFSVVHGIGNFIREIYFEEKRYRAMKKALDNVNSTYKDSIEGVMHKNKQEF